MLRLLDYMLADAIHSMLLASLQHLLQCMHGSGQQQQQQQAAQQQQQVQQRGVVLQLDVLLHEQVDQLYLQPPAVEFMEGLSVWLRSVQRVVRGVPRLMSSSILQVSRSRGSHSWQGQLPGSYMAAAQLLPAVADFHN
jgi:hypothetical protein